MADEIINRDVPSNRAELAPFALAKIGTRSASKLQQEEDERISYLPEFVHVFGDDFLLHDALEFFDDGLWNNVLRYVEARNEYRAMYMPDHLSAGPDDLLRAAEFFGLPNPATATWEQVHMRFRERLLYKFMLTCVN